MKEQTKKLWSMDKTLKESARAVIWMCSLNVFEKTSKIHREIFVLDSLFSEISGIETSSFIEKWLQTPTTVFSCVFWEVFQNTYFAKYLQNVCFWVC